MVRKILALTLFLSVAAFSRVITYTGVSEKSQADAESNAMAGIAKQISVDVHVQENLYQEYSANDSKESYNSKVNLKSNVKNLKDLVIETMPFDGKQYKTKVSLDIEKMTASSRKELEKLKNKIEDLNSRISASIDNRNYSDIESNLKELNTLFEKYEIIFNDVKKWVSLDDSFYLEKTSHVLRERLVRKLESVHIEPLYIGEQRNIFSVRFKAYDDEGPLKDFPLSVKASKNKTIKVRTMKKLGIVDVTIYREQLLDNFIKVKADFSTPLLKSSGLNNDIKVTVISESSKVQVRYNCLVDGSLNNKICNIIKRKLNKLGYEFAENDSLPELNLNIITQFLSEKQAGNITLEYYEISIEAKGPNINFEDSLKSIGHNKENALTKAAKNLKLHK